MQILRVARVIAEICDNEGIAFIAAINGRQRAGPSTAELVRRQFLEFLDPSKVGSNGPRPPTTAVERSWLRPTSWAMMVGLNTRQVVGSSRLNIIVGLQRF
jgi:hypothetical protein